MTIGDDAARLTPMQRQLADLDPSAYAPYGNPREYITSWTDRIWIKRGLGRIHDHYAPGVQVYTAYGEAYGLDAVISNSLQKMAAFPNRGGGHDDVVWESRGPNGFVSSHRVFNNATHLGPWTYGPATGKDWVSRGVAHCCAFRRLQPSIPIETSHLFRAKPAGHSDDPSRGAVRFASG